MRAGALRGLSLCLVAGVIGGLVAVTPLKSARAASSMKVSFFTGVTSHMCGGTNCTSDTYTGYAVSAVPAETWVLRGTALETAPHFHEQRRPD
jgi:hypothetical protein